MMCKTNLLRETLSDLKFHKKLPEDVAFVTDGNVRCSFEEFCQRADNTWYDESNGQFVHADLRIVGRGWWLQRMRTDGEEEWQMVEIAREDLPHGEVRLRF